MTVSSESQLHPLQRSTGSARHESLLLSQEVLCAVNAPVDVQRRDEVPNETYIDVHVRPNHGVGQIRERHLENLLMGLVRQVVLIRLWPRTAVQITLQILKDGTQARSKQRQGNYLMILPALLNAACLALIDAGVPMRCTFSSVLVIHDRENGIQVQPELKALDGARGVHVFSFSSQGELLLSESVGSFVLGHWKEVQEKAKAVCLGSNASDMEVVDGDTLKADELSGALRQVVQAKTRSDNRWRDG